METLSPIVGGIGLFLLGMVLMSDGLKAVAGDGLRQLLQRFTKGPVTGMLTGAGVTALVQSSTATTLATVGFVSAGLLPFANAVGLILGANIGTTATSWMVSLLGLKFSISVISMPMIGAGALLHLLGRGRWNQIGMVVAGFGLIFVGIDTLQLGMGTLAARIDPAMFGGTGFGNRLLLVGVGIVMTVVMQSSSAAAATTLAAVHAGGIDLHHAAALVVGQNVGTTVTAALASIKGGVAAKRTAMAHVLFNLGTGVVALAILPFFVSVVDGIAEAAGERDDAVSLAAFHTAFNVLGVALILPFVRPFSRWIERLVPDRRQSLTKGLSPATAEVPAVAVEATRQTLQTIALRLSQAVVTHRDGAPVDPAIAELDAALAEVRAFLALVATQATDASVHTRHVAMLHVTDHLERLTDALREPSPRLSTEARAAIVDVRTRVDEVVSAVRAWDTAPTDAAAASVALLATDVAERRRVSRPDVLSRSAAGHYDPDTALTLLERMRWLDRASYHLARAVFHLHAPEDTTRQSGVAA